MSPGAITLSRIGSRAWTRPRVAPTVDGMISSRHVISRVSQACLALAVVAASMVVLAQPASAQARVTITGSPAIGSTLTAKVTGAMVRSITWRGCTVKPTGAGGRECSTSWRTQGSGAKYTPTREGMYLRVEAKVRMANGKSRTVVSAAVGPVTGKGPTPTPGGGAKVGLYRCPLGLGVTFISILPGGKYLGPYSSRESTPGNYRLVDQQTMYPGGKVFDYIDGPYADTQKWRNEYYPQGSAPLGTVYDVPVIHLVVLGTPDWPRDYVQRCWWEQDDPYER